ncbi:peptidase S41 family [Pyrenophora seminiperda CCB06]|uniref:Peptidase S41 family n=1 Tax=Pyrenophora seminiperda CCB06 TaxID=1302712 RepID=A0A3M7LWT6_9PLEO|nr:peptidase S41 family [Pyrenophora seminiperda CCB06]
MLFVTSLAFVAWAACSVARSLPSELKPRQDGSFTNPQYICGDIITAVNDVCGVGVDFRSLRRKTQTLVAQLYRHVTGTASIIANILKMLHYAYNCLTSVPFNSAVATRFVKYWNETIQFQSTLTYLKTPPEEYQQPAVDVLAELQRIQQKVDSSSYANQYEFEAEFQLLVYAIHDTHVSLNAGILSAFTFASPIEIASVSVDGKQEPRIYITEDIFDSQTQDWEPSAITTINGTEVNEFLDHFATLNAWEYVEPHAAWNSLMSNPTLDIQGSLTTFSGGVTFYPGDDLIFTFENGTKYETNWVAFYNGFANETGPLATGGDFYNYFVLNLLPESFDDTSLDSASSSEKRDVAEEPITNWTEDSFGAFPSTDIVQPDLGLFGTGFVTGYFYEDISTGVLSLPTFDILADSTGDYVQTVSDFIGNASAAGLQKVVIDLQQNSGGAIFLPFTIFKSFFPDLMPFAGSRRRSFPLANVIGTTISDYWASLDDDWLKNYLLADEWVINAKLNAATGKNFSGWSEYQGPIAANGDTFTLTERYDLANENFDTAAFEWIPTMYLADAVKSNYTRPWNPDQIVLLTDGLCASACTLFVEMMTRVGVRTVVAGGRPTPGPMQAASGTRGAAPYDADTLDDTMKYAKSLDTYVKAKSIATLPDVRDSGMYFSYMGVNIRDQVRDQETTPLQFKYEAADCRIYYTLKNLYNMTQLWHDVSAAAFVDSSLCVQGSTGFSATNNTKPSPPPKRVAQNPTLEFDTNTVSQKDAKVHNSRVAFGEKVSTGLCFPSIGTKALGCPNDVPFPPF